MVECDGSQRTLMAAPAISRPLTCWMARVASAIDENLQGQQGGQCSASCSHVLHVYFQTKAVWRHSAVA